ncbi:MAG: hypothetical protein ACRCXZ_01515 [Patescibacteria group bacterium]
MTEVKRTNEKWFKKGRFLKRSGYDLRRIYQLSKLINQSEERILKLQNQIHELRCNKKDEFILQQLKERLATMVESISPKKHEYFLNHWGFVLRKEYGPVNIKALDSSRSRINDLISVEFSILAAEVKKEIQYLETQILEFEHTMEENRIAKEQMATPLDFQLEEEMKTLATLNSVRQEETVRIKEFLVTCQ